MLLRLLGEYEGGIWKTGDNGLPSVADGRSTHEPFLLPSGEGRGVISARGPMPGDEITDAGDSERVDAASDLTLDVRIGSAPSPTLLPPLYAPLPYMLPIWVR